MSNDSEQRSDKPSAEALAARLRDMREFAESGGLGPFSERDVQQLIDAFGVPSAALTTERAELADQLKNSTIGEGGDGYCIVCDWKGGHSAGCVIHRAAQALLSVAPSSAAPSTRLVRALESLLSHCDLNPEGETAFELAVKEARLALAEFGTTRPPEASTSGPHEPPMVYDPQQGIMVKPGGARALLAELRQLYDKTAEAHEGDYPDKVNHGLVAIYALGQRRAPRSATPTIKGEPALDLKDAPSAELWVESPTDFLEGWSGNGLPPSFHAYAERLYRAYKKLASMVSADSTGVAK